MRCLTHLFQVGNYSKITVKRPDYTLLSGGEKSDS